MKKTTLFKLTVLFGLCLLIFACRKEIKSIVTPEQNSISQNIIEDAKIFTAKTLADNSSLDSKIPGFFVLTPKWSEAEVYEIGPLVKRIAVPTIENKIADGSTHIRRIFLFEVIDGKVVSGRINELISFNGSLDSRLSNIIQNIYRSQIQGFDGAIIRYTLDYRWAGGDYFENGKKTDGETVSLRSLEGGKNFYLNKYNLSNDGKPSFKNQTFAFTQESIRKVLGDGDATGSMGQTHSLSEVVIHSDPSGGPYGGPTGGGGGTGGGSTPPSTPPSNSGIPPISVGHTGPSGGGITLCAAIICQPTGWGSTGHITNLGFVMTVTTNSGEPPLVVPVIWGDVCFTIPRYSPITSVPSLAALAFENAYNTAVQEVAASVRAGIIPPNELALKIELQELILLELNVVSPGSSMSTGPCAGDIPITSAVYC